MTNDHSPAVPRRLHSVQPPGSDAAPRRRGADLTADLTRTLLGAARVDTVLEDASTQLAEALGLARVKILLGPSPRAEGELAFILRGNAEAVGWLVVPGDVSARMRARLEAQVVPALEALLAAALERERLHADAVETEALRRSDELKTALLRSISHDLRTPLTAILVGGVALVDGEVSRQERQELGRAIVEQAERLTDLVDKLLDLSRLQAGAAEPRPQWCSVDEILRDAVPTLDPDGSRFALSIDPDLPLIRGDAAQLGRAFANLLENAARYSGDQRVSVDARVVGERLIVRVNDRGPGIPARSSS